MPIAPPRRNPPVDDGICEVAETEQLVEAAHTF
jgi:hypothetical protein